MVESINTRADFTTETVAYLGFPKYGQLMMGDKGMEFFSDRNVADNMTFPWNSILRVEGDISRSGKVRRQFYIVLQNQVKIRFSSKNAGKILSLFRNQLGDERVVRATSFLGTFTSAFKRK